MQCHSARFRAHVLEVHPRRIEYYVPIDSAETRGEIGGAGITAFDVDAAGDARMVQRPFERSIDLRRTACVKVWYKTADEPQVQRPIEPQSNAPAPRKLHGTRNLQIRVFSLHCDRPDLQAVLCRPEMDRTRVFN